MHLEEEQVQRLLHGEPVASAVRAHVAECAACAARVAEAQREEGRVFALLSLVDAPVSRPSVDAHGLAIRARRLVAPWLRRAAAAVLALAAAGAAYAIPGSPVPAWVDRVVAWVGATSSGEAPPGGGGGDPSGIAVVPGPRFTIVFAVEQARGGVTVWLTGGAEIVARRLGGPATFTTDVDRLTVENAGATADYEIELPRGAPWVEIRVGARRVLLKEGLRIATEAPEDARGRFLVPLAPPAP